MTTQNHRLEQTDRMLHGFIYPKVIDPDCNDCKYEGLCKAPGVWDASCPLGENFDISKNTILLIDDNSSILEFLKEDIQCLGRNNVINLKDYNTISFTGTRCAFQFYSFQQKNQGLNVTHAVIDLEYTGSIVKDDELIKLNGIDVYESIIKYNPHVQVLFFSNKLNPNLKRHTQMIKQFKELTGNDINGYILNKTFLGMRERRKEISMRLFDTPHKKML